MVSSRIIPGKTSGVTVELEEARRLTFLFLDLNTMASIVSPIAQPSRPKSVSRPKRWSEEVEEGTVKWLSASCSEVVPKRIT